MQHSTLFLILALAAGIQARDNWSWGAEGAPDSSSSLTFLSSGKVGLHDSLSSSSSSSSLLGRSSLSFPSSSQSDHDAESSIRTEVISPSVQRTSVLQTVRAPRVIQTVQTVPTAQTVPVAPAAIATHSPATVNNLSGVNRSGKPRGDGEAEGRFLGIEEKLCKLGIGFGCNKGYHHKGGDGLSVYDVSYVQPIQVVPVGGPIAAVPVQKGYHKGHHQKGHYSPPAYHPPQPAYHPPAPVSGYGAPPPATYGAPAPVYHPPKASYGPPVSSYATPSYSPPKASYGHGGSTVVQHIHTHHHVYNGPSSQGGYAFGKDNSYRSSTSTSSNFGTTFKNFGSSIKKIGTAALPAIPPRQGFLTENTRQSAYFEDCQCVERQYCSTFDIVGRSNNLRPLLDARTHKTEILSTAGSEIYNIVDSSTGKEIVNQETQRTKRDTLSIIGVEPATNLTSRQSRQFKFNAYTPGLSGCAASHICCRSPVFRSQRDIKTCGRRNSVGLLGRVKNSLFEEGDTEFGEYPWQAAILKREGADNVYVCGAVLIDVRHLLTAAHCVNGLNPTDLKVRLGEWDVGSETEFYSHIESPVSGVYTHPDFSSGNLNNDIAILRLFSPVDLITNPHISPICLPDRFAVFNRQRCHVTGWGKNAFGEIGNFQQRLKEVELPLVSFSACQSALRQTRLGSQFRLHDGMICAGGEEGKDACEGDGGSPLVCRGQDGSAQLAGLVSWGIGCGRRGIPGVYTNVPHYLTWIRSITRT